MKNNNKKIAKPAKKAFVLKLPYGQFKKGQKIMLTVSGQRYLKSIHKI